MSILNEVIGDKGAELIGALTQQGFNTESAQNFINESGGSIMSALSSGNVDLSEGDIQQKANSLIDNIDISGLASKAGITSEMTQKGLGIVVPIIMGAVQDKLGDTAGIMSLLGNSETGGDLLGSIKKLF